jgi:mRNA-degrading endonuclease RelE of RelBE toxin-antitoxin system
MIYRRTVRFKKAYQSLPKEIQEKTAKAFALFKLDPSHPSLGIKKIKGMEGIWEGRVDRSYRFTFHYEKDPQTSELVCTFRNIDNHNECLKNP